MTEDSKGIDFFALEQKANGNEAVKQQCSECVYLRGRANKGGLCHRYPPIPSLTIHPHTYDFMWENLRPWVQEEEYCGEFKRSVEGICS